MPHPNEGHRCCYREVVAAAFFHAADAIAAQGDLPPWEANRQERHHVLAYLTHHRRGAEPCGECQACLAVEVRRASVALEAAA